MLTKYKRQKWRTKERRSWLPRRTVWVTSLNCLHWFRSKVSSSIRRSWRKQRGNVREHIYMDWLVYSMTDQHATRASLGRHMAFTSKRSIGRGLTQAWLEILAVVTSCVQLVFFEAVPMSGFVMVRLMQLPPKLGLADQGLLKCSFAWNGSPWGVCTCVSFSSVPHVGPRLGGFQVQDSLGGRIQKPLCTINGWRALPWRDDKRLSANLLNSMMIALLFTYNIGLNRCQHTCCFIT